MRDRTTAASGRGGASSRRRFLAAVGTLGAVTLGGRASAGSAGEPVETAAGTADGVPEAALGEYVGTVSTELRYYGADRNAPLDTRTYEAAARTVLAPPIEAPPSWGMPPESNPFHLRVSSSDSRLLSATLDCDGSAYGVDTTEEFAGEVSLYSAAPVSEPGVVGGAVIDFWDLTTTASSFAGTLTWDVFGRHGLGGVFNSIWAPHGCSSPYGLGIPLPFDMLPGAALEGAVEDGAVGISIRGGASVYDPVYVYNEYFEFASTVVGRREANRAGGSRRSTSRSR